MGQKMNPDVKAKWLTALRSGEYAQTKGALERIEETANGPVGFCCLGVLCKIAADEGVIERKETDRTFDKGVQYDGVYALPPTTVTEWAGIETFTDFPLRSEPLHDNLANLNDIHGYTFAQIADIIEEHL